MKTCLGLMYDFLSTPTSYTLVTSINYNAPGTINVANAGAFSASGTIFVRTSAGIVQVAYSGKTGTSFTGCTYSAYAPNPIVTAAPSPYFNSIDAGDEVQQGLDPKFTQTAFPYLGVSRESFIHSLVYPEELKEAVNNFEIMVGHYGNTFNLGDRINILKAYLDISC